MKKLFDVFRNKKSEPEFPNFIERPSTNPNYVWNLIPIGVDVHGKEVHINVSKTPQTLLTGTVGGGKSIIQRLILAHCLENPNDWQVYGVDMMKIELSPYKDFSAVSDIATNIFNALELFRFVQEEMMSRYSSLEDAGMTNFADFDGTSKRLKPMMILVDEYSLLVSPNGVKTDEGKHEDEQRKEISKLVADIARLGRAAGVHLVLSTQRPNEDMFERDLKQNLNCRISAGRLSPEHSQITFDNDNGTTINPSSVKGRGYIQKFGEGQEYQAYYMSQSDIKNVTEDESV